MTDAWPSDDGRAPGRVAQGGVGSAGGVGPPRPAGSPKGCRRASGWRSRRCPRRPATGPGRLARERARRSKR